MDMSNITSKVTAQGQISVPASVRQSLGIGPGSVVEWLERDGEFVLRRAGRCSSEDIHASLFGGAAPRGGPATDTHEAIRRYMRQRHARR